MAKRNCLILSQYREGDQYNDFIGKYYHFPATNKKNYLKQFESLPIEFAYYEPEKKGEGVFYGYGRIEKPPFLDKKTSNHYFVEISDYKPFAKPVFFKNENGEILEKTHNPEYYNASNAVRKIWPFFLDELCLDGGVLLNFKADAHLVQVLGEQLIASERVGILELVKNAFDAGASYCNVMIENIPNLPPVSTELYEFNEFNGPVIVIEDDGVGMTKEQIELGWLRPASTLKTNVKQRLKIEKEKARQMGQLDTFENFIKLLKEEHKGRIPLGEKGVGRFATHRLGSKLILKSKTVDNDYEFVLRINWDDFDSADGIPKDLDSIGLSLTRQPLSRDYGIRNSGTQLIIYGGREGLELTEEEIREINNTILKLNSPNPSPLAAQQSFTASFKCVQVMNLTVWPQSERDDYVFQIYGIVDSQGVFEYDYKFNPPYNDKIPLNGFEKTNERVDIKKHNKNYFLKEINGKRLWKIPTCGSFYIHINVWYRARPWVDGIEKAFLDYLEEYGGLSIFRDGINVYPAEWGAKYDWLKLRQDQISQAKRISYYHMIGNIEIEQSNNIELIDKTNREGMIMNSAFHDLSALTRAVVKFVELDYMGKREELTKLTGGLIREPRTLNDYSKQSSRIIKNIHNRYDIASDPYLLLEELGDLSLRKQKLVDLENSSKNLQKNLDAMTQVQDMLTEQAGFGLGIAVALHEINKVASNFYYGILEVLRKKQFNQVKLEDLKNTSEALGSELMRISPLRALRNEKEATFLISESIDYVRSIFEWQFSKFDIEFSYNKDQDFEITTRYGAVNQILTNMIDNSCYWLDDPEILDRKIKLVLDRSHRTVIVADSGPGIEESLLPYLFQPGYSLKEPQSGLGLYVCKHYMNQMKKRGDIYLVKEKDRITNFPGAQFLLDFSKVIANHED
ncbi:sensor histidine kinase [Pedobacter panaciterrae]|uniref:sensor histidine kinase n=1 Tax=Pedobacter panaciterrae TaxID=363849 RepID=UPI00155DD6FF|nr:sensor histidine kinase [Pedobacter panaciterrae]NQX56867.1 sensor histidine kinase [Pedobacter panaciterrae]